MGKFSVFMCIFHDVWLALCIDDREKICEAEFQDSAQKIREIYIKRSLELWQKYEMRKKFFYDSKDY